MTAARIASLLFALLHGVIWAEESTLGDAAREARRDRDRSSDGRLGDNDDDGSGMVSSDLLKMTSEGTETTESLIHLSDHGSQDDDTLAQQVAERERAVLLTTPPQEFQRPPEPPMRPADYPYVGAADGWMDAEGGGHARVFCSGAMIESDLVRSGIGARWYLPVSWPLEIDGRGSWYREQLDRETADLFLAVSDVSFRVWDSPAFAWRVGAGVRLGRDEVGSLSGYNLLTGFEVYPCKPVSLHGQVEGGRLEQADFLACEAAVRLHWTRFDVEAGYELVSIGRVDLDGPVLGIGLSW